MRVYKQEKTYRPIDKSVVTWALVDDGHAHTSKVKNKVVIHWQPKRCVITNVEKRNG